jgi:peptide/nickel transport system substrate-binding protein
MELRVLRWLRIGISGIVILTFSLSASSSLASGVQKAKINTYKKTGTILYSDWEFPDTLNPFQTSLGVSAETDDSLFAGLDVFNDKAQLIPDLLVNIPSVKNHEILDHGKTIILKLKPHQYWSSGVEITNKDILFGWHMYMDAVTGPACKGFCDHIASIKLKGKYEAILTLKSTYAPILSYGLPPVWPHNWPHLGTTVHQAATTLATDTKFNFEDSSYWTDGPYQVQQFVTNDKIVLTPMKYYHVHPGPYVARLIFVFFSDKDTMIAAANTGQTDDTTDYTPADLKVLEAHRNLYKVFVTPSFTEEHLEFNALDSTYNGHPNPLHNLKVRQALALAVDKMSLIKSALGLDDKQARSIVAYTPFTVTPHFVQMFGDTAIKGIWDPITKKFVSYGPQAVQDARTLLKEAGYGNGFDVDLLTTAGNPTRMAEYDELAKNWAAIGVTTHLKTVLASLFLADWDRNGPLYHGNFQIDLWSIATGPDPDAFHTIWGSQFIDRLKSQHSAIDLNFSGIENKLIDQGLEKGAATLNPKERKKWYTQVQVAMAKGAYWVPLYYRPNIVTSDHHIIGDTGYPIPFGNEWNTYHWRYGA